MQPAREVTLLGFAVDEGVRRNNGRMGARDGPRAAREMASRIPWLQAHPVADLGDTVAVNGDLELAQREHATRVTDVLRAGQLPLTVGGGHELAWGTFQGVVSAHSALRRVLVLNFDAHFDLRRAEHSTSGTSFLQMHEWCCAHSVDFAYRVFGVSEFSNANELFARARGMRAQWWTDSALQTDVGVREALAALREEVLLYSGPNDVVYLSICLDVLPAADAPGVSAPAALGVPLGTLELLLDTALTAPALRAVDIAELNPSLDRDDQTARIAARLAARIIRAVRGMSPAL